MTRAGAELAVGALVLGGCSFLDVLFGGSVASAGDVSGDSVMTRVTAAT